MSQNDHSAEYWETRLASDYSLSGVGYAGLGLGFNTWMYRVRTHIIGRALQSLSVPSQSSILDIGSGTGFMIRLWLSLGFTNVQGSDITAIAVRRLRGQFPHLSFSQMDIGAPPSMPLRVRYSVVSANDVLFHITDDAAYGEALRNVHDLLLPGGFFVFTDNFLHDQRVTAGHQVSRTLSDIEVALRASGFEIETRRPLFVLMNSPIDSHSRVLQLWWKILRLTIATAPLLGAVVGALLYGPELALTRLLKEGPSTEIMLCRRRD